MRGDSVTLKKHHRKIVKDYFKRHREFQTSDAVAAARLLAMSTTQFFDALHYLTAKGWIRYCLEADGRVIFFYTQEYPPVFPGIHKN